MTYRNNEPSGCSVPERLKPELELLIDRYYDNNNTLSNISNELYAICQRLLPVETKDKEGMPENKPDGIIQTLTSQLYRQEELVNKLSSCITHLKQLI